MSIFRKISLFIFMLSACRLAAQPGQIAVPRVEQMPNSPTPYNMRDWRQVALRYDSFVYDLQKTGQYLPLCAVQPAGVNYPQNPSFRLHTYVGTNSPLGNESINVLPSLVSASLLGVDKRNQFGRNWLLMAQDFFNKANGENLYLNNPSTTSGNDWWYDLMPNVFFYQLYDLYPNMGGDAAAQFTAVADRFLEAVRAMGGHDAPWEAAYMNYRAWKFKTMQPNAVGVPEPEAAGAFAWVLFNAWKETGNAEYLKGAEWSLEFLNDWQSNPSYELQLPYGTLTAAKMNAEFGSRYNVEKMVNWSFDRGALRGWGTIVGTWGGFDVSGLVGEANDNGNDYAFQLNGVQQAAAFAPLVRYDKRFARAVGKWMLNLANATRLFYPGFLPSHMQDASAWSAANDPQQVMGYEALRQKWQNLSPFSTGDALQGGWASTNISLYSTSSLGYMGAILEKTNVDKILKINLLKTDFYHAAAYPTYLFYNPHPTAQTITFDAGTPPADIYETLSEQFILQNVNGTVSLTVPSNQAVVVVVCPAGGAVSFEKNKMLVDGVVVDYDQHAQSYTFAPRIKALAAASNPVEIGKTVQVFATVEDSDSGQITYSWSSTAGNLSGTGATVTFTAPGAAGQAEIRVIAADPEGNRDTATLLLSVVPEINVAPQIIDFQRSASYTAPGGTLQLTCLAADANSDPLTFNWSMTGGTITGTGSAVEWTAPATEGIFQITAKVTDDEGLSAQATVPVLVKNFGAGTPGKLIAHYPFTGNAQDVSGNQLHGQANGTLLVPDQNGVPQSAYYFNGGAQHIAVPNNALLNFQDGITVSAWFRPYDLPAKESFLLSHGSWQNRWKLSITPEKYLRWTVNTLTGIADLDATVALKVDTTYHVAVTYDGATLALYLNGNLHSFKALSGKIRTASVPFLMGQMLPGETAYNFKGVMDDVKIFDYALPPNAVTSLHGQGVVSAGGGLFSEKNGLALSPNPVADVLNVRVPEAGRVAVFDGTGRLVWAREATTGQAFSVDVKHWQTGIYTMSCVSGKGTVSARFIKN